MALLHSCIPFTFFLRVARANATPHKMLQVTPQQLFVSEEYYCWFVDPNPIKGLLAAGAMVAVVLAGVMFPLWPLKMRIGVWYLSMGVLGLIGLFFATAIVRLVVWCVTVVVLKPGIWIFPNLFADVGFVSRPFFLWIYTPPFLTNLHWGFYVGAASKGAERSSRGLFADPFRGPPPRWTRSSRSGAGTCPRPRRSRDRPRARRRRGRRERRRRGQSAQPRKRLRRKSVYTSASLALRSPRGRARRAHLRSGAASESVRNPPNFPDQNTNLLTPFRREAPEADGPKIVEINDEDDE